ncbi:MAG: nitroreductase/quinone reductase family protein [Candidatus Nitrosopolaris sp.]
MSKSKLDTAPDKSSEIELTVIGRKSGRKISMPVWFVRGDNILYLLPLQGSDTNWYKNMQKNPNLKISVDGQEIISGNGKSITDQKKVKEIIEKFKSKYGDSDVKKYYTEFDAYVELDLKQQ